jgi:Ca2+-binding RTX toxin-like protein
MAYAISWVYVRLRHYVFICPGDTCHTIYLDCTCLVCYTRTRSIPGNAAANILNGGAGNDTYVVDSALDVINEATTTVTEIDSVQSAVSWTMGNNLENLTLAGNAALN